MKFNEHCPVCNVRVGSWMRGCSNCGKADRLVSKMGKYCKICSKDYKRAATSIDKVICIHNRNFEVLDKNGAYIYEFQ